VSPTRLKVVIVLVGLLAVLAPMGLASADGGNDNTPPPTVPEGPTITAVVTQPGETDPGDPGETVPVPCAWFNTGATEEHADNLNDVLGQIIGIIGTVTGTQIRITITFFSQNGRLRAWNEVRARFEQHQTANCSNATEPGGVSTGDTRWVAVLPPSPAILLPSVTEQATKPITTPTPTLSPANRAPVNLGMWLAVQPSGPISVRADLGPLWAETTATMVTTSFDLGTGEAPIVCAGHGTPIPDSEKNSIAQGPCGYTYTSDTNGDTLDITITSTWTVTWALSDGTTGSEPDIVVSAVLPYEVYEIQTVGTGG